MKKEKKAEDIENIKDQIIIALLGIAAGLGSENGGMVSDEFAEDCIRALDTMNFDYVVYMLNKLQDGKYGVYPMGKKELND